LYVNCAVGARGVGDGEGKIEVGEEAEGKRSEVGEEAEGRMRRVTAREERSKEM